MSILKLAKKYGQSFGPSSLLSCQRNGGSKVDFSKENIKTLEIRKAFKVNSKTSSGTSIHNTIYRIKVHPVIKHLFSGRTVLNMRLAGWLKYFQKSCQMLTKRSKYFVYPRGLDFLATFFLIFL